MTENLYLPYDYLNIDGTEPLIKILVSYIKPSFLFKSDILIPIHLGRAVAQEKCKDGIISDEDYQWLIENCIGDSDFEGNISEVNRRVGFLTGTYWAWKNYEKLGNPKFFGSFGYRRLLNPDFLENLEDFDLILPKLKSLNPETIKEQFIRYHGSDIYQNMICVFEKVHPTEMQNLNDYLEGNVGYFDEIYVMKKSIFFDFCSWIFPLLFEFLKLPEIKNGAETRDIAFIMERLTGYYCYQLIQNPLITYCNVNICITEHLIVNKKAINADLFKKLKEKVRK